MGFEGETVVISNGEEVYIWRPKRTSTPQKPQEDRSFIEEISSKENFRIKLNEYAPRQQDCLWIDPRGLSKKVEEGCIAKLRSNVPIEIKSSHGNLKTFLKFKYCLTRPGTVNAIICSENHCSTRKSMADETVRIACEKELIEEQVTAKKNPLKP